jgi:hypothetical protein
VCVCVVVRDLNSELPTREADFLLLEPGLQLGACDQNKQVGGQEQDDREWRGLWHIIKSSLQQGDGRASPQPVVAIWKGPFHPDHSMFEEKLAD